jgi:pyruvate kinase
MERRTRIVATLGPASQKPQILESMIRAGLDVARINFSHGEPAEKIADIAAVRDAARRIGRNVAVLADLPGPKLRVRIPRKIELTAGSSISICASPNCSADLDVTEPECLGEVRPGQRVLMDDGRLQLVADRLESGRLIAKVTVGGELSPNKGLNLPDTHLTIPALTERDRAALNIASQCDVDWIALSFVRDAWAGAQLRREAAEFGLHVPIIAKIERPEAVDRADEIIGAFDGVMVARGDLGVEIPLERVPSVQKRLIALARKAGKPVITATDMLDSMRENPRPTRAEASDVANAIYDGTDAVMLSGETAVGKYPVESVNCMDRIAREVECEIANDSRYRLTLPPGPIDDHVTHLTCDLAHDVNADAIVTPTMSGRTARLIARHRPAATIVAPTASESVLRQMAMIWGVRPVPLETPLPRGADRLEAAIRSAFNQGAICEGQLVVVLAGHPSEGGDRFPTIRLVRIGPGGTSTQPGD